MPAQMADIQRRNAPSQGDKQAGPNVIHCNAVFCEVSSLGSTYGYEMRDDMDDYTEMMDGSELVEVDEHGNIIYDEDILSDGSSDVMHHGMDAN